MCVKGCIIVSIWEVVFLLDLVCSIWVCRRFGSGRCARRDDAFALITWCIVIYLCVCMCFG